LPLIEGVPPYSPAKQGTAGFLLLKKLALELNSKLDNGLSDWILFLHTIRDSFTRVQNCSMIPASEGFSDLVEGGFGVAPSQIHRHLPRKDDIRDASLAVEICDSNFRVLGHLPPPFPARKKAWCVPE
jgi:hypothetical protein